MAENKPIRGNYFLCENEVFVEGKSIGQFQSFKSTENRQSLGTTAEITLPFYTMAAAAAKTVGTVSPVAVKRVGKNVYTYIRINPDDWNLKTGAHIQVYAGYSNNNTLGQKFSKLLVFDGFIREVIGGFPTTIKCEDASFILKFGTVTKSWPTSIKLVNLVQDLCDLSNTEFDKYRKLNGFTATIPTLVPRGDSMDTEFVLKPASGVSPYDILSRVIMGMYKLYGGIYIVDNEAQLWCGVGLAEVEKETVLLDTSVNVIGCNIIPTNMLFDNFYVKARYLAGKELVEVTAGSENGIPYELPFTPNQTAQQMKVIAENTLQGLRANRNKGTLTTLLYPKISLFDYISFTHTIFKELSGGYYVIGRELSLDSGGYKQILTVTNKTFLYLAD